MNRINPKKLLNSKWTAVKPVNKEKHFLISDVEFDEEGNVMDCELEAVMSRRKVSIDWRLLNDSNCWLFGWK
ncbi:TIGR02450 family Trp-rich protein [Eionea flava]